MKIQCLPRKWFEVIKGTVLEEQVLAHNKVVSIQSRSGWDSAPPFSEEALKSPNLLCLMFDDVTDYSDLYDGEKVARFRPVMASRFGGPRFCSSSLDLDEMFEVFFDAEDIKKIT